MTLGETILLGRTLGAGAPAYGTFPEIDGFRYVPALFDAEGRLLVSAGTLGNYGRTVLSGAAEQLIVSLGETGLQGVSIKAHPDNAAVVYVGADNGVGSAAGYPLGAGDSLDLAIDDSSEIWVRGTADDIVGFIAIRKLT